MPIDLDSPIYDLIHIQEMYNLWFRFKNFLATQIDKPKHFIFEDYDFTKLTGLGIYQVEDDYANKMYFDAKRNSFIVSIPNNERLFYNFFTSGSLKSLFSNNHGLIYQIVEEEYSKFSEMEEDELFYLKFMLMRNIE